ncbi:MAG TPA: AAA family ATPase [bacterium]|nr:AAA family ATPase [bacterium]HPT29789.1 AAA family ATPase [bacterium]
MYLEKLEIQGFKSFAQKNRLVFPGIISGTKRGITAVVGPNGSGKSNIADAVRWALGEQSLKTLRGKKSDDVIFSGSDQKGRLGMAEVSLHLNNQEGIRKPLSEDASEDEKSLDFILRQPQIIITRRIYRDGESEYLLNNARARLSDIQILLAKANFGQKTYSVIGQGMVEGFLNTSLAERKDFFDEATGVKQYQIKRDISLNKLQASYENLNQVEILLNEIEPRLKSLTRQVNRLERRSSLEIELRDHQLHYYRQAWHDINDRLNETNNQFLELEKIKNGKDDKLAELNLELNQEPEGARISSLSQELEKKVNDLQLEKEKLTKEINRLDAYLETKWEAAGAFDLAYLNNRRQELNQEVAALGQEKEASEVAIRKCQTDIEDIQKSKAELNQRLEELNSELRKVGSQDGNDNLAEISRRLNKSLEKLTLAEAELDIEKIKAALREIREELEAIGGLAAKTDNQALIQKIQNELAAVSDAREAKSEALNAVQLEMGRIRERQRFLLERESSWQQELAAIAKKLEQSSSLPDTDNIKSQQAELRIKLAETDKLWIKSREELKTFQFSQEDKRRHLFELQKSAQNLQLEIARYNNEINDIKVSATRYETRLEDLEADIRSQLGDLKEVKEEKNSEHYELEPLQEKIDQLKKSLDMIGGIDPEVTKEYETTKERYDFLFQQTSDLNQAIKSLEKVIYELDVTIKERFDEEFKVIQEKFTEYFKILFNGGNARIVKVMADEVEAKDAKEKVEGQIAPGSEKQLEYNNLQKIKFLKKHNATGLAGIEIEATPPGKKIRSISMLSGGERALTAIALISAIISANPSPFVVLDEVDAALDEANSERLAQILDDLSDKTQFIVITHNRASMRKASVLYGITMQADGISQLLSVKLDEVKID